MFYSFLQTLRAFGLKTSLTEWMVFLKALDEGLLRPRLDDLYFVGRALLVKSVADYDTWDQAFMAFTTGLEVSPDMVDSVLDWLSDPRRAPLLSEAEWQALQRLDLEELKRLFMERLQEQTERHDGGSRWVGTGGTSPFGHSGRHPSGIRVGGQSGNMSAIQVAAQRRFSDYRTDLCLDVRQIQVALKKLRRLKRTGTDEELDIDGTIDRTSRNAGDLEIVMCSPRENQARLLLLMDVGGSMTPFARLVSRLFSAAHSLQHFKDFKYFYFHNCPYEKLYTSAMMDEGVASEWVVSQYGGYYMVLVGDAHMAPSELVERYGSIDYWHMNEEPGVHWLGLLQEAFPKRAWLNPLSQRIWHAPTIRHISSMFPMFPLTVQGLDDSVAHLLSPQ